MGLELHRPPGGPPWLVGHRGACAVAPENTLVSFAQAVADGADVVEMDVRLTADEQAVVMHDATVDRTTNGEGRVSAMTLAELTRLDAGSWFDARFAGERVPALAEVLAWAKGRVGLLLELKYEEYTFDPRLVPVVLRLIHAHGVADQVAFISRTVRGLQQIAAMQPGFRLGPLTTLPWWLSPLARLSRWFPSLTQLPAVQRALCIPLRFTRSVGCNLVVPNIRAVTLPLVEAAHAADMPVSAGGATRDCAAAIATGVDTIATDNPASLRRFSACAHLW